MMISNAFGIIVGIVMGKKIPERAIKWGSAVIFIGFGAVGLFENLPESLLTPPVMVAGVLAILLLVLLIAWRSGKKTTLVPVPEKQYGTDQN